MTTPQYNSYGGTTARTDSSPLSRLDVFKKPPDPETLAKIRKKKVKVLEEDDYVEQVEKIIERDFFPELEKLKAQADYFEARERKDYATMSRLQEKYSGIRPGTGRLASPATFETPQEPLRDADPRRPSSSLLGDERRREDSVSRESGTTTTAAVEDDDKEDKEKMNLDKFLANHTSEDNESFNEIQEEAFRRHRVKNAWMYKDERMYLENKAAEMVLPSIEEQADPPPKPLQVETWTFQNINSVFHNPDTLELSHEEKMELAKKQKIIKHDNTRLTRTPWKTDKQNEILRREAERQRDIAAGKVGVDGKELARADTPMVNGFKMVSMAPSPYLGVADSPLMTWGEVESTPYRLEGCDTPLHPISGPGFTIREVPKRDRIAKELADKNSRYYRERKQKAIIQVKSSMKGGRPGTAGLDAMSPAAQRLVSSKLGIRLGTDDMLRASYYTPSPSRRTFSTAGTPTPRRAPKSTPTPTSQKKKAAGAAARTPTVKGAGAAAAAASAAESSLRAERQQMEQLNTDNLLNLSTTKRPRAQDFFMKPSD